MFIKREFFLMRTHIKRKKMVDFVNNLGYLGDGVPSEEAHRKRLKYLLGENMDTNRS